MAKRGLHIDVDLEMDTVLNDGDALRLDDGGLVLVKAAQESLLEVRSENPMRLIRLAWQLGSQHGLAEVTADAVYVANDPATAELVRGQGCTAAPVLRAFRPEQAIAACDHDHHGHGHHDHDHHGHAHDHGAHEQHAHEHHAMALMSTTRRSIMSIIASIGMTMRMPILMRMAMPARRRTRLRTTIVTIRSTVTKSIGRRIAMASSRMIRAGFAEHPG